MHGTLVVKEFDTCLRLECQVLQTVLLMSCVWLTSRAQDYTNTPSQLSNMWRACSLFMCSHISAKPCGFTCSIHCSQIHLCPCRDSKHWMTVVVVVSTKQNWREFCRCWGENPCRKRTCMIFSAKRPPPQYRCHRNTLLPPDRFI